jgi:hypothetical protein
MWRNYAAGSGARPGPATYQQALLGNVLNPKAASVFLTVVPQFVNPAHALAPQVLMLATAQAAPVAAWLAGWALLLGGAARYTGSSRAGNGGRRHASSAAAAVSSVCYGEDDVGRLDDRYDLAAGRELELVGRLHGDRGDQPGAARVELDVGGGLPGGDAGDRGRDLVARAELHE